MVIFVVSLLVRSRTIVTSAIFMSFRIMNDTKKPDHDKKYSTNRAGIRSVYFNINNKKKIFNFFFGKIFKLADDVKRTEHRSLSTFSDHCSFAVNSIHNRSRSIQMPDAFRLLDSVCHVLQFCSRLRSADAAPCTNSRSKSPVNKWKHFIDMCMPPANSVIQFFSIVQ